TNDPQSHPGSAGLPAGHPPIKSFLNVPLILDRKIVGSIGVGNREGGYSYEQQEDLEAIAPAVMQVLQRRKADENLRLKLEELARSNAELEQFAYVSSHDLQEPLRMISSYLQLLQRRYQGKIDEKADKYIYFAVDGAARMQVLINDLLEFSRVTTKAEEPKPTDSELVFNCTFKDVRRMHLSIAKIRSA
ncbi:MAG: sensor histidine kinase, partial [Parachlamydiaceae bacterium]